MNLASAVTCLATQLKVLARSAFVSPVLGRVLSFKPFGHIRDNYPTDMAAKYQFTPEQLALQEERKRKKAEKQAASLANRVPTTGKDAIIIREWLRRRQPRTSESSIRIMNWNVRANISVCDRDITNAIEMIYYRCSRKRSFVCITHI